MANLDLYNPPRLQNRWTAPGSYVSVQSRLSTGETVKVQRASVGSSAKEKENKSTRTWHRPITRRPVEGRPKSASPEMLSTQKNAQATSPRSLPPAYTDDKPLPALRKLEVPDTRAHERGRSAPPTSDKYSSAFWPVVSLKHTRSVPHKVPERPLPPLPSSPAQFRLGGKDLPWSTPDVYLTPASESSRRPSARLSPASSSSSSTSTSTRRSISNSALPSPRRATDDPQRVQELSALSTAMMTVDTLSSEGWDAWMWDDGVGMSPRGPKSLGWAVSSESSPISPRPAPRPSMNDADANIEGHEAAPRRREPWESIKLPEEEEDGDGDKPPPYCVSQWEARFNVPSAGLPPPRKPMGRSKSTYA